MEGRVLFDGRTDIGRPTILHACLSGMFGCSCPESMLEVIGHHCFGTFFLPEIAFAAKANQH